MTAPNPSVPAESGRSASGASQSGLPLDTPTLAEMVTEARRKPGTLRISPRGDLEILMSRFFAAPAAAVFAAWTTPDLLERWLMPSHMPLTHATLDLRPGGTYRFEAGGAGPDAMAWGGAYLEVEAPKGFITTERFEPAWYPGEATVALALHEGAGGTVATLLVTYESLEARDTVLRSPMDAGLAEAFKRLEEVLRGA